jgi:short-subunit dehydrogenase
VSCPVRWQHATVLITGASRGIGRVTARLAAEKGASIALVARSTDALDDVLSECGGRGIAIAADVARRDEVEQAFARAVERLGPIDILVNCAGIGAAGAFAVEDLDRIDAVIGTNLLGVLYATRAVVPPMIDRRRGHIVNVGSISGRVPVPMESVYSAAKFGVAGFTGSLAFELEPYGIGVSLITAGPVDTDFQGGMGQTYVRRRPRPLRPEQVAEAIIIAVERGRSEKTVPRWLVVSRLVESFSPALYRVGARRAFRTTMSHPRRLPPSRREQH